MRNKMRSFLTMAGIAWGVASIVIIVAMGDGFKQGERNRMKALGENIVIVWGGRTENQAGGRRAGRLVRLTYDDVRDIRSEAYLVRYCVGELQNSARAQSPHNSGTFNIIGVEPLFSKIRTIAVKAGRFINDGDDQLARRVCVIGHNVKKQLYADRPIVVGTEVRLNGLPYEVIGYGADKNQTSSYSGLDVDNVWIPYSSMVRDIPEKDPNFHPGILDDLIYVPKNLGEWDAAQHQVRSILGRNHHFDPLDKGAAHMWDTVENAEMVDMIFTSMTAFLGTIAIVTLTLGGIGVMNIMLVTVTERTPEIGLRKALGATRRRILLDFLLEGVLLAAVSGAIGWLVSWSLASLVNSIPKPEMFGGLPIRNQTTLIAFGALGFVAVTSAMWPAWKASALTPVEALRYER